MDRSEFLWFSFKFNERVVCSEVQDTISLTTPIDDLGTCVQKHLLAVTKLSKSSARVIKVYMCQEFK